MIFTDYPVEDTHILGITDLHQQRATALLDIAFEHMVALVRYPHDVDRQAAYGMTAMAVASHSRPSSHPT